MLWFFIFSFIILVKLEILWLSKIFGMSYNLEWREYLIVLAPSQKEWKSGFLKSKIILNLIKYKKF